MTEVLQMIGVILGYAFLAGLILLFGFIIWVKVKDKNDDSDGGPIDSNYSGGEIG